MITEIKRTPITYNGKDGWEILVSDTEPEEYDICDLCMYRDWDDWENCDASCIDVHGCLLSTFTYFIFQQS